MSSVSKYKQTSDTKQEKERKTSQNNEVREDLFAMTEHIVADDKANRTRKAEETKVETNPTEAEKVLAIYKECKDIENSINEIGNKENILSINEASGEVKAELEKLFAKHKELSESITDEELLLANAYAIGLINSALNDGVRVGKKVSEYARQLDLFGNNISFDNYTAMVLADILNSGKQRFAKEFLYTYLYAATEASSGQLDIFSDNIPTKEELLIEIVKAYEIDSNKYEAIMNVQKEHEASKGKSNDREAKGVNNRTEQQGERQVVDVAEQRTKEVKDIQQDSAQGGEREQVKEQKKSSNVLVTDERYEELKKRMRAKLAQLNMGIDPEILAIGTEMAVFHIEKGARSFSEYAKRMIADLGDTIRPYLKSFYNGARDLPEMSKLASEMTSYNDVSKFNIASIGENGKEVKPSILDVAEQVSNEADIERNMQEDEKQTTEFGDIDNEIFSITKQHNNKKGVDIWVVRGKERTDKDTYSTRRRIAKDNNGYYSSFRGVNGFVFNTYEEAQSFANSAFDNHSQEEGIYSNEITSTPIAEQENDYIPVSEASSANKIHAAELNGFNIGDRVMYNSKEGETREAIIDRFEYDDKVVLDVGLAPMVYELASVSDIAPLTQGSANDTPINGEEENKGSTENKTEEYATDNKDASNNERKVKGEAEAEKVLSIYKECKEIENSINEIGIKENISNVNEASGEVKSELEKLFAKHKELSESITDEELLLANAYAIWLIEREIDLSKGPFIKDISQEFWGVRYPMKVLPYSEMQNNKALNRLYQKEWEDKEEKDKEEGNKKELFEYFKGSIKDFINKSKDLRNTFIKAIIANVNDKLKDDLRSLGVSVSSEYKHTIDSNAIKHALNRHGSKKEWLQGQQPITEKDIEYVYDVIENYDNISIEKNKREQTIIVFSKTYPDNITIYIEEVRTGRKELAMVSIRKKVILTDANSNATQISDLNNYSSDKGINNSGNYQEKEETISKNSKENKKNVSLPIENDLFSESITNNENENGQSTNNSGIRAEYQGEPKTLSETKQMGEPTLGGHIRENSQSERRGRAVSSAELGTRPRYDVNKKYSNDEIAEIVSSITEISNGKVVVTGEVTDDIKSIARKYVSGGVAKKGRGVLDEYYTDEKIVDAVRLLISPYIPQGKHIKVKFC